MSNYTVLTEVYGDAFAEDIAWRIREANGSKDHKTNYYLVEDLQRGSNEITKRMCNLLKDLKQVPFDGELKSFIDQINKKLLKLHMAIRRSIQENHNKDIQCYVLTNSLNNEMTRIHSSFTKPELSFIKQLIEMLITTEGSVIGVMNAINSGNSLEFKVGVSAAEALIEKLVHEKWLLQHDGQLSLGCLTVCELHSYIQNNFEDECSKCYFCKEYTFRGLSCPECSTKSHRDCIKNYWRRLKKEQCCPNRDCTADWEPNLVENRKRSRME